jgi:hypothetical protein
VCILELLHLIQLVLNTPLHLRVVHIALYHIHLPAKATITTTANYNSHSHPHIAASRDLSDSSRFKPFGRGLAAFSPYIPNKTAEVSPARPSLRV